MAATRCLLRVFHGVHRGLHYASSTPRCDRVLCILGKEPSCRGTRQRAPSALTFGSSSWITFGNRDAKTSSCMYAQEGPIWYLCGAMHLLRLSKIFNFAFRGRFWGGIMAWLEDMVSGNGDLVRAVGAGLYQQICASLDAEFHYAWEQHTRE